VPPLQFLLATTNSGKIREIRSILDGVPVDLVTLTDLPAVPEPEETGATFAENALQKGRYYAAATGLTAIAEDSGLAIDALGGRPGVASARYPGRTYPEKFERLYKELAPFPRPWTARYVCSVAVVAPAAAEQPARVAPNNPRLLYTTEATVEGEIAPSPRGSNGFGYDPIFFYPPYDRTMGEVDDARKLAVAHRGKAIRALRTWLMAVQR
jgi:XTP/dITP diphosphohydrolase